MELRDFNAVPFLRGAGPAARQFSSACRAGSFKLSATQGNSGLPADRAENILHCRAFRSCKIGKCHL